jgi:predicted dithiol-disulfide oxidoreductase (DUF899 family)
MSLPKIVSESDWRAARKQLLVKEKALTRARDALSTERRELPMVEVTTEYVFETPEGKRTLADLFDGRRQLIVQHFMFDPEWEDGCPSCSAAVDEISDGFLRHLNARDTTFVIVARAPLAKIERYKQKKGWAFPFVSSNGSDFNYDFHVTLDPAVAPVEYNYRAQDMEPGQVMEGPGYSCFLLVDARVFHTYSTFARGTEQTGGAYYFLDMTALGRQEDWEEPTGRAESARAAVPNFE